MLFVYYNPNVSIIHGLMGLGFSYIPNIFDLASSDGIISSRIFGFDLK